jgi:hypothetical protein
LIGAWKKKVKLVRLEKSGGKFVSDYECFGDKLSKSKMEGQFKPIDKNLQLQLPGYNPDSEKGDHFQCPIYSHYMGSSYPPSSYPSSLVNETELFQAMAEAESSYKAWKQMQQRLKEIVETFHP